LNDLLCQLNKDVRDRPISLSALRFDGRRNKYSEGGRPMTALPIVNTGINGLDLL
jgi:hypothetical protein